MGERMPWWVEYKKLVCFVVVLISSSAAYRLIFGDITLDLGAVSMFDILSISVAFFAIAISFAFYFQASNTSNQFYDNTYKFTNEVSEILGRIEGAFGEKLSHLDDSYSRMDKKLDRNFNPAVAKEQLEQNEDKKESSIEEQNHLINDLLTRAHVSEKERDEFFEKWKETQERLMRASEEISVLNRKIEKYRTVSQQVSLFGDIEDSSTDDRAKGVISVVLEHMKNDARVAAMLSNGDFEGLQLWYKDFIKNRRNIQRGMRLNGYEVDGELTRRFFRRLNSSVVSVFD